MNLSRQMLRFVLVAVACLLVSCIDGREEIWLNADASGRVDLRYSLPATAARFQGGEAGVSKLLGEFLSTAPGITTSSYEVSTADDRIHIHVRAAFDSALDFKSISSDDSVEKLPSSASHLLGIFKVGIEGRTVDFRRTVSPGRALPGVGFLPASQFEGRKLEYIVHLPVVPETSNATRVENEGKTLVWDYTFAQAVKKPLDLRFVAKAPIPGWIYATAGAVILFLVAIPFGIRSLRRKNASAT